MIFDQLLYERPNIVEFEEDVFELLGKFDSANSFEEQFELIDKINSRRNHVLTMLTIAEIRAQLDTSDKKYQEEQKFINKNWPVYEKVVASYYERLIKSTFKEQIRQKYGKQLLNLAEINVNTIGSSVIDKLKRENNLISEYTRLMANAKIEFKGEERNLSQLDKFVSSSDRMLRKQAIEKKI
ncbi:hypothetical protein [Lysinibacillus sp. fls2-241-R2A-57]|uniref:hypothetical protein n=1 Tax=Lysinibacillus sp. fls2-241-R2A-57 TaxID=3040292 RepID=UPI00255650BC|nr:hypothetical protein [Lysinibacillus sp. fls2-241-R2A-57]